MIRAVEGHDAAQAAFFLAREALLAALEECRPLLDSGNPPSTLSFVLPFDPVTGRPRKVIWRSESERDLTPRRP